MICPGCHDEDVEFGVCRFCLASHPEDWVFIADYHKMVDLAYAAGQRPQHLYNEAQLVLAGIPSFQPRQRRGGQQ